jgi:hypothetical protein
MAATTRQPSVERRRHGILIRLHAKVTRHRLDTGLRGRPDGVGNFTGMQQRLGRNAATV